MCEVLLHILLARGRRHDFGFVHGVLLETGTHPFYGLVAEALGAGFVPFQQERKEEGFRTWDLGPGTWGLMLPMLSNGSALSNQGVYEMLSSTSVNYVVHDEKAEPSGERERYSAPKTCTVLLFRRLAVELVLYRRAGLDSL